MKILKKIKLLTYPQFWWDLKYNIKCYFNSPNKWVTKSIPLQWRDKDYIIEEVLFAAVIDLVEKEEILKNTCLDDTEYHQKFKDGLLKAYNWAKVGRVTMEKKIDASYPHVDIHEILKDGVWQVGRYDYSKSQRYEEIKTKTNTKFLRWIVENRENMWT